MKHLKTFENYDLSPTEDPSISSAKVSINQMNDWISEFKSKRNSVDLIYRDFVDQKDLRSKLLSKGLISKEGDGVQFENPLLGSWASVAAKSRQIFNIEKELDLLSNSLKDNAKKMNLDPDLKDTIDEQNKGIEASIIEKRNKISEIAKEMAGLESKASEQMKELQNKMKFGTKTIGN
jgi:hypothetical protein